MKYQMITWATLLCLGGIHTAQAQKQKPRNNKLVKINNQQTKDVNPEDIDLKDVDAIYKKNVQTSDKEGCAQTVTSMTKLAHGMELNTTGGILRILVSHTNVLHISYGPKAAIDNYKSYVTEGTPDGCNFTAVGCPYWTSDIGGYSGGAPNDPAYRELFTRWFEYGAFCSIFRAHGRRYPGKTETPNEPWSYGAETEKILTHYIDMRYKLLPYIYSLSAMTSKNDYNPMRLLAYDFAHDKNVLDSKDQFMYGPLLMVCPVLHEDKRTREVYLPKGQKWIDYWTNRVYDGGSNITTEAPIEKIPLFVRAGSIIPSYNQVYGNDIKHDAAIRIDIYAGANGKFDYYEDDGTSMDYKQGKFKLIPLRWDDTIQTLSIDAPEGSFSLSKKQFEIYLHKDGKVTKMKKAKYTGKSMNIKIK